MPEEKVAQGSGLPEPEPTTTIDRVAPHSRVDVVAVEGGRRLVQRLASLGIVPGARLTVIRPRRPTLVRVGAARIAIGHTTIPAVHIARADR